MSDIIFHVLDIQARDVRIESETEDVREIVYESHSDSDEEFKTRKRKRNTNLSPKEFVIHLFGADETGKSIRCDVTGFRPTLYIKLPETKTVQAIDTIKQYISSYTQINEINIKRIHKKIFYGFTANTLYPFLQIDVPSLTLFRNIRNLFLDEHLNPSTKRNLGINIEIFEANIDPMLRFIHTQNIQPCGWVCIKNATIDDSVVECDYTDVIPTKGPVSAPFLTASWDIECFSMTGDFPLAKRTWKKAAKDIIRLAHNSSQAIEFITNSLSPEQIPVDTLPKGMTPIYCKYKNIDTIKNKLIE